MAEDTITASDPVSETPNGSEPQSETLTSTDSSETLENATETPQTSIDPDALQKQIASLEAALRKANKEAKDHRIKASELTKFKDEIEAAKLSESEKLQKQLAALQAERDQAITEKQELRISTSIMANAAKVGINPNLAAKILDRSELDFDGSGEPTNVEDLLKGLLKEYPNLATTTTRAVSSSGGATNPPRSQTNNAQLSWDMIGKMTAEQYDNRRSEINQWMAKNMPR